MLIRLVSIVRVGLAAGIAAGLPAGCGGCGDDAPVNPDGGTQREVRLEVVSDESLGLGFGESATLRVQYEYENREVIPGAEVSFAIIESKTGDPGGSTLSATSATTDAVGMAMVDVTAGAARANFRVEASAPGAAPAYFYVSVSEDGFATLVVTPRHQGNRSSGDFDRVELRLYRAGTVTCAELDVDDPPVSVFPPMSVSGFDDGPVRYENVSVGMDLTLVGWALVPGSTTRVASGCVDLPRNLIAPGERELAIAVRDRRPALPAGFTLHSTFLLTPVAAELAQAPAMAPWNTLACAAGPGQLILDCTLDALEPDGVLDCVVSAATQRVTDVEAARGEADAGGCRPLDNGGDTLDKELLDAVAAGASFPTAANLDQLLAAQADATDLLELTSLLDFAPGTGTLSHRLFSATLTIAGTPVEIVLGDTARPVVTAGSVPWFVDEDDNMVIAEHGFTLRLGSLARRGFRDVGLATAGLESREADLGAALTESAADTMSATTGCDAVSAIVCARIGESADCARTACAAAAGHLDDSLQAWWQHLDGVGIDFVVTGGGLLRDENDDLLTDSIGVGSQGQDGGWTATFRTRDGDDIGTSGSFGSTLIMKAQR